MSLFFNVCYFPFWLVIAIVVTVVKYAYLNYLYKFILVRKGSSGVGLKQELLIITCTMF